MDDTNYIIIITLKMTDSETCYLLHNMGPTNAIVSNDYVNLIIKKLKECEDFYNVWVACSNEQLQIIRKIINKNNKVFRLKQLQDDTKKA